MCMFKTNKNKRGTRSFVFFLAFFMKEIFFNTLYRFYLIFLHHLFLSSQNFQ